MKNDLISIVVPVYNVENYIDKCINSIINQTYDNLEIILVDDGSTDGSGKKCDYFSKLDKRIIVIHKKNGGLSDARNTGIDIAKGKYITFIDSDDYIEYDYIEYLYNLLKKYNVNIAFCGYLVCFNNKAKTQNKILKQKKCTKIDAFKEVLYAKNFEVSAWAKIYLLEHFKNVRYPRGKLFEDNATTYKLIEKNDFIGLGYDKKYNYVMRKNSITKKEFTKKHFDYISTVDDMCNDLSKYPELNNAIIRKKYVARISTLNRMITSKNRNIEEEKKLRIEILKYKFIFKDKNVSLRDKIGFLLLKVGINFYKFCWIQYLKIKGRC